MNKNDIATARLNSQQITGSRFSGVKELVGWMGVMQAQDAAMANWAIGARLPEPQQYRWADLPIKYLPALLPLLSVLRLLPSPWLYSLRFIVDLPGKER